MRKLTKRVLAVLLSLAMTVGLIFPNPIQAKAAEGENTLVFTVTDTEGNPLSGANVSVVDKNDSPQFSSTTNNTDNNGKVSISIPESVLQNTSITELKYVVSMTNYESSNGTIAVSDIKNATDNTHSYPVTLRRTYQVSINADAITTYIKNTYGEKALTYIDKYTVTAQAIEGVSEIETTFFKDGTGSSTTGPSYYTGQKMVFNIVFKANSPISVTGLPKEIGTVSSEETQSITIDMTGITFSLDTTKITPVAIETTTASTGPFISGEQEQLSLSGLDGWNVTGVEWTSSDTTKLAVVADKKKKKKATATFKLEGDAVITAAITIGDSTAPKTVTKNIHVSRKSNIALTLSISSPESGNYNWQDPVTFKVTAPSADFNGQTVTLTFKDSKNVVHTKVGTFNGNTALILVTPKTDLEASKKDTFTVTAATNGFDNTTGTISYGPGSSNEFEYSPALVPQNPLTVTLLTAKTVTYGDAKETGAPEDFYGILIGTVDENGSTPDVPAGEAKYSTNNTFVKVDNDGNIWLDPHCGAGEIKFTVTKNGGESYSDVTTAEQKFTVNKYVIISEKLGTITAVEKIYDGTENVTVNKTETDANKVAVTQLAYDESGTLTVTATADKNAGDAKAVTLTFALDSAWEGSKNYQLAENLAPSTPVTVKVKPRELHLTLADATTTAEWVDVKDENINSWADSTVEVAIKDATEDTGFVTGESAATLTGFQLPQPKLTASVVSSKAIGPHTEIYVVPTEGNPTSNYTFVFADTDKGTLTINPQKIDDSSLSKLAEYLKLAATGNHNVFQTADLNTIYYSEDDPYAAFEIVSKTFDNGITTDYSLLLLNISEPAENSVLNKYTGIDKTASTTNATFVLANAGKTHYSEPITVLLTQDKGLPEADIVIKDSPSILTSFTDAITFNVFHNGQQELKASITVKDDISGIKEWKYVVVNAKADIDFGLAEDAKLTKETFDTYVDKDTLFKDLVWNSVAAGELSAEAFIDRVKQDDVNAAAGNYIVFVWITDNVGNSVIYSSKGNIFDNFKMTSVDVSYDTSAVAEHFADFFTDAVKLNAQVTEDTDNIYSGVATLIATVTQDGESADPITLIGAENIDLSLEKIKSDYGLKKASTTIDKPDSSKAIEVSFEAFDYAGNDVLGGKTVKKFVIDPIAPEIEMEVSSTASRLNGMYYNADVTVTTTITERYLDLNNDLKFTINGVQKTFGSLAPDADGIKEIKIEKVADETKPDDNQQTIIHITFKEDNVYNVSATVMDKAGNKAEASVSEFVVDKTAPSVTVTYYGYGDGATFTPGTTEAARTYLNADYSSFKAVIAVNELNFSDGSTVNATYKVTAVDSEGKEVSGINVKDVTAPASWESQKYSVDYTVDANYTFEFDYTDLAGNKATVNVNPTYITLDKVVPEGTVTVSNMVNGDASKTWDALVSAITFGLFGKDSITASMTSKDATAGVATTQYLATSELLSKAALAARTDWTDYKSAIALAANENVIVYEKVTDKAGNVEFYSSENIVVDNTDPAPEVTIVPTVPAWNKGVYAATDKPGFDIIVTDPIKNGAYSGLQTITYKITAGSVEETSELASYTKGSHTQEFKGHVDIDPEKFYSNDVQVTVTASDFSTNEATSETKTLKIDSKAPVVSFSFDTSDAQNGKYYNKEKTLTITVDERNFDPSYEPTVTSTTGGGYSFSGWTTNGETTTGTVTFSGDSDYTVTFDCYDLAGNKSNTENLEEFTVDMTNPVISVSYDNNNATNGNYYKAERTATITIEEHNFNSGNVSTTITAELDGESIDVPVVSEWASNGDTHTATVRYPGDGDYTFNISYVDQAGNTASEYKGDAFTVDKTNPELTISGVQDKSANNGTVAPVINASDINFNSDNLTWTLTGVNNPDVDASGLVMINATEQSATITFSNFPEGMDDIYTLTAKAVDAAGNETTKSITFSVNRDGSTYIINESTQKLIDKQITNNPQDIVITEINVDTLEFIELSYTKDGQVIKLEEGKDYTVEEAGGDGQWKQYTYTIKATAFSEEGEYSINIYSEDTATNSSTNKAKEMIIDFIVDKTAPTVAVANLEDMGRYQEEAHEFNVTVKDNAVLAKLEIYRDGELWQSIEGTDLLTPEGYLTISLPEAGQYQDIELIAYDAAGNVTEPLDYRVLVTSNGWIQFYNNKPLFGGSIAGVAAVGGVIAFLIAKRKKKEEDK